MGTSVIGRNVLGMKLDFIFVMSVSLNSNINLKLNNRLDKFINGSMW